MLSETPAFMCGSGLWTLSRTRLRLCCSRNQGFPQRPRFKANRGGGRGSGGLCPSLGIPYRNAEIVVRSSIDNSRLGLVDMQWTFQASFQLSSTASRICQWALVQHGLGSLARGNSNAIGDCSRAVSIGISPGQRGRKASSRILELQPILGG